MTAPVADPGDPQAMLEIAQLTLQRLARFQARLSHENARDLRTTLAELELYLAPAPLPALPLPPPEDIWIHDRRRLRFIQDLDGDGLLGRGTVLRFWDEDKGGGLRLGVSSDLSRHGQLLHASISYDKHLPSWRDVREVKDRVFGDVDVMFVLPRAEDYVNQHQYCFHLTQMPARWAQM